MRHPRLQVPAFLCCHSPLKVSDLQPQDLVLPAQRIPLRSHLIESALSGPLLLAQLLHLSSEFGLFLFHPPDLFGHLIGDHCDGALGDIQSRLGHSDLHRFALARLESEVRQQRTYEGYGGGKDGTDRHSVHEFRTPSVGLC